MANTHIQAQAGGSAGNGGNLILRSGSGYTEQTPSGPVKHGIDGSIIFQYGNGQEALRFDPDGTVMVRGEKVDSNFDIYKLFLEWFDEIIVGKIMNE